MRGFRAWHTKLNRYLEDDEFFIGADGKVRNDSFGRGNYEEAFDTSDFDSGYIILEQYTGLRDKNGKKICEGDIVKWNDCVMKVVWENDFASFELVYPDNSIEEGMFANEYMRNWVIIGNIHENAELLEEEE